jgi:bifunctional non-homologous end joining protein LigD
MKSLTLYCREGGSDKVYQIALEERPGGYAVNVAYGRRGSTLTAGTKTPEPVAHEKAVKIYDKLVREKTAKGYTLGPNVAAYLDGNRRVTSVRPQLLNSVEITELSRLLADDAFVLQAKFDGRRMLIQKRGEEVIGINRRGIECGVPETIRAAALVLNEDFLIDGEAVGDRLHVFDLLERNGKDMRGIPYRWRLDGLEKLLFSVNQVHLWPVDTY